MSLFTLVVFLVTYFICSINPAIIVCKKKTGQDIRKLGSGNAGSANAMRVLGRLTGTVVVALDVMKVLLSFGIITALCNIFSKDLYSTGIMSAFVLASVIGHVYPIYYGFKGGKGVVVAFTTAFLLNHKIALICIISAGILMLVTKIVSVGALGGVVLYNIIGIFYIPNYSVAIIIVSLIILFKHRENIARLIAHQEGKIR